MQVTNSWTTIKFVEPVEMRGAATLSGLARPAVQITLIDVFDYWFQHLI